MKLIDLSVYTKENKYSKPFSMSIKFHKHTNSANKAERLGVKHTYFYESMVLIHKDFKEQFHSERRIISNA